MPVLETAFVKRVTAALRENKPPRSEVPVPTLMPALAMNTPLSVFEPPRTALPTQKKTLHALAPPVKLIAAFMVVVKVVPIWKMNCALMLPPALRVSVPVRPAEVA